MVGETSQTACSYNEVKLHSRWVFYPYGCLILPLGPDPGFICKALTGYCEFIEP